MDVRSEQQRPDERAQTRSGQIKPLTLRYVRRLLREQRPTLPAHWRPMQRLKNGALFWASVCSLRVLTVLPCAIDRVLARLLGGLAYRFAVRERRRALANLAFVWPAMPRSRRRRVVRQMFRRLVADALAALRGPSVVGERRLTLGDRTAQLLDEAERRGQGTVFVSAHFGNWEAMGAAVAARRSLHVFAKRSYDPRFSLLLQAWRARMGVGTIWVDDPSHLRRAARLLRSGAVVGMLADLHASAGQWLSFLGRPASTTLAPVALARACRASLICGVVEDGRVGADAIDQPAGPDRWALQAPTQHCQQVIASAVRRRPSEWLWSLKRFAEP